MGVIRNRSIKTKLLIGFLMISVLLGIIGLVGAYNMRSINNNARLMYSYNLQNADDLHQIKENLLDATTALAYLTSTRDETGNQTLLRKVSRITNKNQEIIEKVELRVTSKEDQESWENFKQIVEKYRMERERIIEMMKEGSMLSTAKVELEKHNGTMFSELDCLIEQNQKQVQVQNENNSRGY